MPRTSPAFSILEVLVVLAVMAVLGSVAMVVANRSTKVAQSTKLTQDVATLNSAVRVFKANGGKIANSWKISKVLEELKTKADTTTGAKIAGLRGSMLDPRIQAIDETYEQAASGEPKALWDSVNHRFYISSAPIRGIRRFEINQALAETAVESRARTVNLALSAADGWVWNFTDAPSNTRAAPRSPDAGRAPSGSGESNGTGDPLPPSGPLKLNPPVGEGGNYDLYQFPITFGLTNQNPAGASHLMVSIDGVSWTEYISAFPVEAATSIFSYAESKDPALWTDSDITMYTISYNKVPLVIALAFDKTSYRYGDLGGTYIGGPAPGSGANRGVISLMNGAMLPPSMMSSDHFQVRWTYDGTSPLTGSPSVGSPFSGTWVDQPLSLGLGSWASGAATLTVSAVAKSLTSAYLEDSPVVTQALVIDRTQIREPAVARSLGNVSMSLVTSFGDMPVGARIFYNTNGVDPGNLNGEPTSGTIYTGGAITVPSNSIFVGRAYAPSSAKNWFFPSESILIPGDPNDKGLVGGHIDVDTSSFIAQIGKGSTDGHVHEYDEKFSVIGVDYFNLLDSNLHNISRDISNTGTRFKLIVSNPSLSTGGRLVINSDYSSGNPATYNRVTDYAATSLANLPVYSLGGVAGTTKLTKLQLYFAANAIITGGIIPTNTGDVRGNTPGRKGEWRNGALTIQAVAVNADGSPAFTTDLALSNGGVQGVARSGLLWETTVFQHWGGLSYHQSTWNPGQSSL